MGGRPEAFAQLDPDSAQFTSIRPTFLEPPRGIPDPESTGSVLSGLHAMPTWSSTRTRLAVVGFCERHGPAFTRNVEVLVEMTVTSTLLESTPCSATRDAPILLPYDAERRRRAGSD